MKRIVTTLAALTISTGAFAIGPESAENYGSILYDRTHPASNVVQKVNTHKTKAFLGKDDSSYGSAIADLDAPAQDRSNANVGDRGLDSEISVGNGLFMDSNDNQF